MVLDEKQFPQLPPLPFLCRFTHDVYLFLAYDNYQQWKSDCTIFLSISPRYKSC